APRPAGPRARHAMTPAVTACRAPPAPPIAARPSTWRRRSAPAPRVRAAGGCPTSHSWPVQLLKDADREAEAERRALAFDGFRHEVAAVCFDEAAADVEAETRARRTGGGPPEELGEDPAQVGGRDAVALVDDRNRHLPVA